MKGFFAILLVALLAGGAYWMWGRPSETKALPGLSAPKSPEAEDVAPSPEKAAASALRAKARALLDRASALDNDSKAVVRRVATSDEQFARGENYFLIGDWRGAKELYESSIKFSEKALAANDAAVAEAAERIKSEYLAETVAVKRLKMPSKDEIEVTESALAEALKEGADASDLMNRARYTEFGSERYVFDLGAFRLAVKERDGALAAEAVHALMDGLSAFDYAALAEIIETEAKELVEGEDELSAALELTKLRVAADELRIKARKQLKKNPEDAELRRAVAEALVILGEWDLARKQFEKLDGDFAGIFSKEEDDAKAFEVADFWWQLKSEGELNAEQFFKARAVRFYKLLLGKGNPTAEEKAIAEARVLKGLL